MFSDHLTPVPKPPLHPWWIALPVWLGLLAFNANIVFWLVFGVGGTAAYKTNWVMIFSAMYIGAGVPAILSLCFLLTGKQRTAYAVIFLAGPLTLAGAWLAW